MISHFGSPNFRKRVRHGFALQSHIVEMQYVDRFLQMPHGAATAAIVADIVAGSGKPIPTLPTCGQGVRKWQSVTTGRYHLG